MAIRRALHRALYSLGLLVAVFATAAEVKAVTLTWNANPEGDIAGYKLFWGETNTAPNVRDVGKVTRADVTGLTAGRTYRFYITAYNTAGLESDPSASVIYTASPPPISVNTAATFVRPDTTLAGSWRGALGAEGGLAYPYGTFAPPSYVKLSAYKNYPLTWAASTTDPRALLKRTGTDRFAAAWHSTNDLLFYFNFTDTAEHQVSFYFVDFDRQNRQQLLEFYNNDTGKLLASESIANFGDGRYSIWNLRGNVRVKLSRVAGPDVVLSAFFFDKLAGATATFVSSDATSSGSWKGRYGQEGGLAYPYGYFVPPTYVQLNAWQNYPLLWASSTTDTRALQRPNGTDRMAGAWHSTNELYFYLQFKDTATHKASFYFVDFDRVGRQQKLEIFDHINGNLLHSQVITNFANGVYKTFNLSGKVRLKLTKISGPNCVMSGILFDPSGPNIATFAEADTATSGTWKGIYGAFGNTIAGETATLPAGTTVTSSASPFVWSTSTTDTTALQRPTTGRVASAWAAVRQSTTTINISDTATHAISLYFVDFDNKARVQTVEIIDPRTGAVLDNTEIINFRSGIWLSYDVKGSIQVRVTSLTGASAVLSGIFFD